MSAKSLEASEKLTEISRTVSYQSLETSGKMSEIWRMLSAEFSLSWSHYVVLLSIKSVEERRFYEIETSQNSWGIRELKRQINASLYERLALSRDQEKVRELSAEGQLIRQPKDVLKSPYVLEFLGLEEHSNYSEHDLEKAIIDKIEHFLLELGKGFYLRRGKNALALTMIIFM